MDNGQDLQHGADGPYYNVSKTPQANKRKSQDDGGDGGSQGRAKRNRYISIAWYASMRLLTYAEICNIPRRANGWINTVTNANDARSNAMARTHANAAEICLWIASTPRIAAPVQASRSLRNTVK